jgi:hypothetical protein
MSSPSDWLLTFLVEAPGLVISHDPYCIGTFELSRRPEPLSGCERALAESAKEYAETVDERSFRLRTFFINIRRAEALRLGRLYAREVLTLFRRSIYLPIEPVLRRSGCILDLKSEHASPFRRTRRESRTESFGSFAILDEVASHPTLVVNTLLSTASKTFGELGQAVRRSAHWSGLGFEADDYGERFLMLWMAAETLTREHEGEALTPKLTAAAGFPASRYELSLPEHERKALANVKDYEAWKKRLHAVFEDLRAARNAIAHSGFRELDLQGRLSETDRLLLRRILPQVVGQLQNMALNALQLGITTVGGMWKRFGECFLLYRPISFARHIEGNVLYLLTQPENDLDD